MNDQILGLATLIFCSAVYIYSYFYQKKENYAIAVILLMLGGFALRRG